MVYSNPLDFLSLAQWIANALGVSLALGELFASLLVAGSFLIVVFFLRSQPIIIITIAVLVLVPLTAIGWIPVYTWILIALYLASSIARNWKELF